MRILASIRTWLVAGATAVLLAAVAFFFGRTTGRDDVEAEQAKDVLDRVEKGREAVRDGRDDDPADRLRRNDGRW